MRGIRRVEVALGDGRKRPAPAEREIAAAARRRLVAARDIPAGTRLTETLITIRRPGTGLAPSLRGRMVGATARTDIAAGTVLTWDLVRRSAGRNGGTRARKEQPCRSF